MTKIIRIMMPSFLPLLLFFLLACDNAHYSQEEKQLLEVNLDTVHVDKTKTSIYISKSKMLLSLMQEGEVLKNYPVVFGFNSTDDKLRQGDGCTPEGNFKVRDLYPHRSWSKFIWIDYPNEDSWKKHRAAKAAGKIAEDAAIGGEIGIHGVPAGSDFMIDMKKNWTLGCISLKNEDVNELYSYIQRGTPITIVK